MKKFLCVICLLLCFMLTGCNTVSYVYDEMATGEVSDTIIIPISKAGFKELGLTENDYDTVLKNALAKWGSYAQKEADKWQGFVNIQSNIPDNEKPFYLNGVKFEEDLTSDDHIAFKITFATDWLRSLFYTWDQPKDDEAQDDTFIVKNNMFTYNNVTATKTFFASTIRDNLGQEINIVDYFYNEVNSWIAGSGVQLERPSLSFNYSTIDARLHSDADTVTRVGYNYVHSWTLSGTEAQKVVHFYYTEAIRWPWYVIAFGVSLITMGIVLIVYKVKKNKVHEKEIN